MLCLNKVLPYKNKSYLLLVDQSILYIIKTLACLDKIAHSNVGSVLHYQVLLCIHQWENMLQM